MDYTFEQLFQSMGEYLEEMKALGTDDLTPKPEKVLLLKSIELLVGSISEEEFFDCEYNERFRRAMYNRGHAAVEFIVDFFDAQGEKFKTLCRLLAQTDGVSIVPRINVETGEPHLSIIIDLKHYFIEEENEDFELEYDDFETELYGE